jgi:2-succinyl-5-enolpyruvyl-6-hydroxy-3-cyclohexene-1-carboxylate synthase
MTYQGSDKPMVQLLVEQCYLYGIKHVVLSPGSRNAPLIITFANHPGFTCYSIIDERSAGFYALGMARQLNEPVALVCTSGTAVLNLAPALAEAYYQNIPLVAITADRPPELIGQEDGQTICQPGIYRNYTKQSINLSADETPEVLEEEKKALLHLFRWSTLFSTRPIHINVPIREPLYGTALLVTEMGHYSLKKEKLKLSPKVHKELIEEWDSVSKIMIVCGVQLPNKKLNQIINELSIQKNIPVLATSISNLEGEHIIGNIDKTVNSIPIEQMDAFAPDLLITLGGPVVSKKLKQFIRNTKPRHHWDLDEISDTIDTYGCLTRKLTCHPELTLAYLTKKTGSKSPEFRNQWQNLSQKNEKRHTHFLQTVAWSDMHVYHAFLEQITKPIDLHLGNSSPVRYIEFFEKHPLVTYYCNRGTSGIDGSSSTAAGAAIASGNLTVLITGDVSFVYDSNALWNRHLPHNLRILVINNGGGNIFRLIPGPAESGLLKYFETPVKASIKKICQAFGVDYLNADSKESLTEQLPSFLDAKNKMTVLEVFTQGVESAKVFKEYLKGK